MIALPVTLLVVAPSTRPPALPALPRAIPLLQRRANALLLILAWIGLFAPACTSPTQQEALFCPADGCADRLVAEIDGSTESVHVAIAYFNHTDIAQALIRARDRGVDVKVLGEADESEPDGINYTVVQALLAAGVSYRDDANPSLMHDKFTIIDGAIVLTGSFNYTYAADERNNENLVVLVSSRMAESFENEFDYLWAYGIAPSNSESGEK